MHMLENPQYATYPRIPGRFIEFKPKNTLPVGVKSALKAHFNFIINLISLNN